MEKVSTEVLIFIAGAIFAGVRAEVGKVIFRFIVSLLRRLFIRSEPDFLLYQEFLQLELRKRFLKK